MANKVKFGFKNAYYATIDESGDTITYGTPKRLEGAVSMTLSASGDDVEFYADDSLYFGESVNNGYEGSLELALVPEDFKKDVLGEVLDSNNVLVEDATVSPKPFALLCEFTANDGAIKYTFYRCTAKRPNLEGTTKGATKEVKTETLDLMIRPRNDGKVKVSTVNLTDTTVIDNWYTEVYEETISA